MFIRFLELISGEGYFGRVRGEVIRNKMAVEILKKVSAEEVKIGEHDSRVK